MTLTRRVALLGTLALPSAAVARRLPDPADRECATPTECRWQRRTWQDQVRCGTALCMGPVITISRCMTCGRVLSEAR